MSKPKAKRQEYFNPEAGRVLSVRFVLSLLLIALGIAWVVFYYLVVRVDPLAATPGKAGGPSFMQDVKGWNYLVGFGLSGLGLLLAANPVTPLGRGRGVVVGMLGCFLLGLLWICTFYVVSNNISGVPIMNDLGQKNLVVGIGLMAIGFAYATRWE